MTCNIQKIHCLFCAKGRDVILHFPSSKFLFKIEKDEFDNQLHVLSIMIFFQNWPEVIHYLSHAILATALREP